MGTSGGACDPPQPTGTAAATHAQNARRKNLEIVTVPGPFFANFSGYLQPGRAAG